MQEDIRISICIPTYNKYETIKYTILSVIKQSYKNWELLILDDSSNNYTEEIVETFGCSRLNIKYIRNKERLGLVRNWNECIKQANFEYVYILHHDDFLMPGVLQAYNNFAKANPACGIIHSNCYYLTLPYLKKTVGITQDCSIIEKGDRAIEKILFNNNLACSSVMVKKECYDKLGGFDERAWVSPDWEMWARIGRHYELGHLNIIGCAVILDNQNTHLSAIDITELYAQQQYYYDKIISYFTAEYKKENPLTLDKAKKNLDNTILKLGFHFVSNFKFLSALSYMQKIRFRKMHKFPIIIIRTSIRFFYLKLFRKKITYSEVYHKFFDE